MDKIERVALLPNLQKKGALACSEEIVGMLQKTGYQVCVHRSLSQELRGATVLDSHENLAETCDVFVAVGGDGTIIHAAKHAAVFDRPVLGINMGRVGYMAGLERDQLTLLPALLGGEAAIEKRRMLRVRVGEKEFFALNDAVLSGELSKILDFRVSVDQAEYLYRADGLILATPTGSTAYSLSAGGPVVDPKLDCMIFTPICPHSLFNRSVIYGSDTKILLKAEASYTGKVFLTVDGEPPICLGENDVVEVTVSPRYVRLMKHKDHRFFDSVNKKLLIRNDL